MGLKSPELPGRPPLNFCDSYFFLKERFTIILTKILIPKFDVCFHVPCLIPCDCWQGVALGELCLFPFWK